MNTAYAFVYLCYFIINYLSVDYYKMKKKIIYLLYFTVGFF